MLITDLDEIKRRTQQNRDAFEIMGYMLEFYETLPDTFIDETVEAVAAPIRAAIDCTQCANCCRGLQVHVTPADVNTLAAGLDCTPEDIRERYITHDQCAEIGEWGRFKQIPCPFLDGKLCSIYPHRPEACRAYPFFTDFRWLIDTYIEGAERCPIIYNTLIAMTKIVDNPNFPPDHLTYHPKPTHP